MFTRRLDPQQRDMTHVSAALALGDSYRPRSGLQLQFGGRLDASRFPTRPEVNPALEELGVTNDRLPASVFLSPRFGFSWTVGRLNQIPGFSGAQHDPRAVVRGGVGLFRMSPSARLIGGALDNTGLPSGARTISCVGDAVPRPEWAAYRADEAAIPSSCADGGTGSVFATDQPSVTLFHDRYAPPTSLRSNLSWSGLVFGRVQVGLDGIYSRNMNQPGVFDLNLREAPGFMLAAENGRPVYADADAVVPGTGAIGSRSTRERSGFGSVLQQRSDLVSESRVVTVAVQRPHGHNPLFWTVEYSRADYRVLTRGFGETTAGDPRVAEWGRSTNESRHQFFFSTNYSFSEAFTMGLNGRLLSGARFTPLVAGDVNGDGYANDRAFISREAIEPLLPALSPAARRCLAPQLGRIADRASCQGPWTAMTNLFATLHAGSAGLPRGVGLNVTLSNPLAALDRAFHGADGMRGWGQAPRPDANLLYVRGFDPAGRTFVYEVNRRFGEARSNRAAEFSPAKLTISFSWSGSPEPERQMLRETLGRGRDRPGSKLTEAQLKAAYATGGFPNPLSTLLQHADSLGLTSAQADSIMAMNRWYLARVDSIWAPVVQQYAALPQGYDPGAAYEQYRSARLLTIEALLRVAPATRELLGGPQRRKVPPAIMSYLEKSFLEHLRADVKAGNTHG